MTSNPFKTVCISIIWVWLGLFAIIPLTLVLVISFLSHSEQHLIIWHFTLKNYTSLFQDIFLTILLRSFVLAVECTILCLLLAYPAALIISRSKQRYKNLFMLFIMIPFWTSALLRTYGILAIIKTKGLINSTLLYLHIIHQPLQIIYSTPAVLIGLTYNLMPFMLIPLFSNMDKLDSRLFEAARDLGASRFKILKDLLIPLTMPGIVAGTLLVFLPAMTLFYIPDLLGGAKSLLLGNLIQQQFLNLLNWPAGCATSIVLTLLMLGLMLIYHRSQNKPAKGLI